MSEYHGGHISCFGGGLFVCFNSDRKNKEKEMKENNRQNDKLTASCNTQLHENVRTSTTILVRNTSILSRDSRIL